MKFIHSELRAFDLNLCLTLAILVRERSVTATAARLNVGPPAISMALGRLRDLTGDPLLVRKGRAMVPTRRAMELMALIDPFLGKLENALHGEAIFDPRTMERHIRLAISDDLEMLIVPRLLSRLEQEAPHVTLHIINANYQRIEESFQRDEADVCIVAIVAPYLPQQPYTRLYADHFVSLFDPESRVGSGPFSLDEYLSARHLLISEKGDKKGMTETKLEPLQVARHVTATLQRFSSLPLILKGTSYISNVPAMIGEFLSEKFGLAISPLPFESPVFEVGIVWDRALASDPFKPWFEQLIHDAAAPLHCVDGR